MIEITSLDHEGRGIAKINGKIVFVNNALPNEIVNFKILKEKSKYIEADVTSIIKRSSKRVRNVCPYYDYCGGCNIMHMNYEEQVLFKKNKIKNIVEKYLNKNIKVNTIIKSDNILHYRNKTTFQVKEKIGFYKKKSYELIKIDSCMISDKLINNSIKYLNKLNLQKINKIVCRTNSKDLMIIIETNDTKLNTDAIKPIASSIYIKCNNKYHLVYGNQYIVQTLDKYNYIVGPDAFFQINLNTSLKLYKKIKQYVGNNKNVLDLYCGTGSIGIFISETNNVTGIEINSCAIENANKNKLLNNIENIKFICDDSGKAINRLNINPDIIIVDPPRGGMNRETIKNILKFKAKTIIYVSCDPLTMVRDLNLLKDTYEICEITPFDMFPHTHHVECITLLRLLNEERIVLYEGKI